MIRHGKHRGTLAVQDFYSVRRGWTTGRTDSTGKPAPTNIGFGAECPESIVQQTADVSSTAVTSAQFPREPLLLLSVLGFLGIARGGFRQSFDFVQAFLAAEILHLSNSLFADFRQCLSLFPPDAEPLKE